MRIPFVSSKAIPKAKAVFNKLAQSEILSLRAAKQEFSDCYLVSSLHSLTKSTAGREVLLQNISKSKEEVPLYYFAEVASELKKKGEETPFLKDVFDVVFKNVQNKEERYSIDAKTMKKYYWIEGKQKNSILSSVEMAMKKLVGKHFFKKPLFCRMYLPFMHENFENNKVSNFMEMFTGKKPINLCESKLNINLKPYKKEALELFERMGKSPYDDFSFVAGTGVKHIGRAKSWHCYVIKKVDLHNKRIFLINKRTNNVEKLSFDEALDKLKYIVGYFNENLK